MRSGSYHRAHDRYHLHQNGALHGLLRHNVAMEQLGVGWWVQRDRHGHRDRGIIELDHHLGLRKRPEDNKRVQQQYDPERLQRNGQ